LRTHHIGEEDVVEAVTIEVSWGGGKSLTICQIYRKQNDVANTMKLLEYLARLPEQTLTVGDFNFPTIRWEEGLAGSEVPPAAGGEGLGAEGEGGDPPPGGQHPGPGNWACGNA
jgi:hypothetical protein